MVLSDSNSDVVLTDGCIDASPAKSLASECSWRKVNCFMTYEEIGQGAKAVLIHGSPGNSQSWKGVVEGLAEDVRMILPTIPGHEDGRRGESYADTDTVDIASEIE